MLEVFAEVHVCGVVGNHGRLGRKGQHDPRSNSDKFAYEMCKRSLSHVPESRLTWNTPGSNDTGWMHVDNIGEYSCLLLHGDEFGSNMRKMEKMVVAYQNMSITSNEGMPEFKDVAFGHY